VGYLSPLLGKEAGLPVFATPQNVEALAGGHAVKRPSDYPLAEICVEMAALRRADSVHAICQAEQWFMAWHGVQAGFLPYHPPAPIRRQMLDVRARRTHTPNSGRLLMMGTTTNPPTRQGMLIVLAALSTAPADAPPLDVIGTGTEALSSEFSHPRFHFHGRVSTERLDELLAGAKATIVHQPLAIGALTRIAEMLMSGLPVLANPIAARSTGHHQGVYVFEDEAALNSLCAADLPMPPVPAVPELVRSAIRSLQKLAGERLEPR
jgi:glycosyltransferase involved in cell wall biosynthesis